MEVAGSRRKMCRDITAKDKFVYGSIISILNCVSEGAEVLADVDNNEQRHGRSGSQRR